jgi:recombinational DNA repair ATPase RecF
VVDIYKGTKRVIVANQALKIGERNAEEPSELTRLRHSVALECQKFTKVQRQLESRRKFLEERLSRIRAKIDQMIKVE